MNLWDELERDDAAERLHYATSSNPSKGLGLSDLGISLAELPHHPTSTPLLNNNETGSRAHTSNAVDGTVDGDYHLLPPPNPVSFKDGYGAAGNLDTFFASLYSHYYNHGTLPAISRILIEATTLLIVTVTSAFLIYYIDFTRLLTCTSESACNPSFHFYVHSHRGGLTNFFLITYLTISLLYLTVRIVSLVSRTRGILDMGDYYTTVLKISPRDLHKGTGEEPPAHGATRTWRTIFVCSPSLFAHHLCLSTIFVWAPSLFAHHLCLFVGSHMRTLSLVVVHHRQSDRRAKHRHVPRRRRGPSPA